MIKITTLLLALLLFNIPAIPAFADDFDDKEFENFSSYNQQEIYDPLEKYNRKVFAFNDFLDRYCFEYVAKAYQSTIPKPIRNSIGNVLTNLTLPISAVNSVAQGKFKNAFSVTSSFLINSTVGIAGIFDVAGSNGIFYKTEKFSNTLGHYGSGSGAYLMLPFLGPSSVRDFSGFVVDRVIDPMGFNYLEIGGKTDFIDAEYRYAYSILYAVDTRERLLEVMDDIRKDSFDPYATVRSAYLQRRKNEVEN